MSTSPRVSAVSYLNTSPLVWGMLRGPQQSRCRLSFDLPSRCADKVVSSEADFGIVPVVEVRRHALAVVPGTGIACRGAVRSILLVSRVEPRRIRNLAADLGSRTSIILARLLLRQRHGSDPEVLTMRPDLDAMLEAADAALLIGDAALRLEPGGLPYLVLDLGQEWLAHTGLPMVFAVWAGRPELARPWLDQDIAVMFRGSLDYGLAHMDALVREEAAARAFPPQAVRDYLARNVVFHIGAEERRGMDAFLKLAAEFDARLEPQVAGS